MTKETKPRLRRTRAARKVTDATLPPEAKPQEGRPAALSKLQTLIALLSRSEGATLESMMEATGWQKHSVRGVMAGTLKKKGYTLSSTPEPEGRVYRIGSAA